MDDSPMLKICGEEEKGQGMRTHWYHSPMIPQSSLYSCNDVAIIVLKFYWRSLL